MEETVKKYIRSLLTSAPVAVQMFQLEKDYKNTIGESIPYQKLGYNSLEHFLRSIPETVVVRGTGREAEVVPVITEKSAHINQLVARQKVNNKGRHGRYMPRKYLLESTPNVSKKIVYPNRQPEGSKSIFSKSEPKAVQPLSSINVTRIPSKEEKHDNTHNSFNNVKKIDPIKISNLEKEVIEAAKMAKNESNTASANDSTSFTTSNTRMLREKIKRSPDYGPIKKNGNVTEPDALDKPKHTFKFGITKKGDINRENFNSPVINPTNVPPYIQKNLKNLISFHPDGIWCAELPLIYRRMFNADLNYQEYGFRSLIELCTSLTSIFHYARPSTEDFRLYDGSKPLPQNAAKKFTIASYSADDDSDSNNALPTVDWEDLFNFLPKDIFQPGADIPRVFVPESTKEYDSFGIIPGEIYDISKFWVFLDNGILDNLMDQMQDFYRFHHNEYHMSENLIREGLYCVQIIFGEYHRAIIIDILPDVEDMIRVLYIDYGTVARAPIKGLCFLHEQFAQIPAQAIRCRLANIVPPLEGAPWSKQSTKFFRQLITGRDLKATVIKVNWDDQFLDIFLVDVTNPKKTFYINDRLVEEGHAEYPDKERKKYKIDSVHKCKVKQIHLFPTFAELEHGLAPSTAEMTVLDECGVPIYFAYPQYFDIDTTSEKKRVETTDHWYQQNHRHKRDVHIYHYDISKIKPKPLNLEYFGTLAEEISELVEDEKLDKSFQLDSCHSKNQETENVDNNNSVMVDFAVKLKKDCLLAQDIMSDLQNLYVGESSDKLKKDIEFDPVDGFWSVNGGSDFKSDELPPNSNIYINSLEESISVCEEAPDSENVFPNGYLLNTTEFNVLLDYEDDYLTFPSRRSTPSCYSDCQAVEENKVVPSKGETESVASEKSSNTDLCTNPFLEDLHDSSAEVKSSLKDLVLHPNNPFLTYRTDERSDESSNSTVYGGVMQEVTMERWSIEDSRTDTTNNFENASSYSDSSGSLHTSTASTCAIATQTVVEDITTDDTLEVRNRYLGSGIQVVQSNLRPSAEPFNYSQNWLAHPTHDNYYGFIGYTPQTAFYNQSQSYIHPVYPRSLSNFGHQYRPGTPFMPGYPTSVHRPQFDSRTLTATTTRPPPGFASNSNIYQVSRVMQTTVSSNVVADGSGANDFYDLYNARLKLALESTKKNVE